MKPLTGVMLMAAAMAMCCGHSDPAAATLDRGVGPFNDGDPTRLNLFPMNVIGWTADGQALLVQRDGEPVVGPGMNFSAVDPNDTCLSVIPASGGSSLWSFCNDQGSHHGIKDSVTSASLRDDGRLLTVMATSFLNDTVLPIGWQFDLWLSDTTTSARTNLLELFRTDLGTPTVPAGTLNWIGEVAWSSGNHFIARAGHLTPTPHEPIAGMVLVEGTIANDSATLRTIAPISAATRWRVGPDGMVLQIETANRLSLLDPATGTKTELPQIDMPQSGMVLAARCNQSACWAVTSTTPGQAGYWKIWKLNLGQNSFAELKTMTVALPAVALLSPQGNHLYADVNGILYQFRDALSP